ncbi:MAG: glycosyltransferase family 39 protein [Planctomycetota bacterium]
MNLKRLSLQNSRVRVGLLLGMQAVLLAYSGWWQSPTLNEPGHLVAGLGHWKSGDFALYRVNPPLIRLVASIPVTLAGYEEDWSGYYEHVGARPVFDMAEEFVTANGRSSLLYFRLARWSLVPFSLLGAWVCFAWARDLFGDQAGLMAATLWCFSPMVLGHGSMIAPDAHATSLGLAACYTFWRWLKLPTWRQAILTGVVLGFAELSKTTMILFYPLWPLLWITYRWRERRSMSIRRWRDEAGMLILRMLIGLYVLNLGYLGEGSFTQLKDFRFVSDMLTGDDQNIGAGGNRFADSWLGEVPVPLPANYIIGIDVQQRDFENFSRPSYLRGEYQAKGWWYYYTYAILVKAPLGTLGLILVAWIGSCFGVGPQADRKDLLILLTPAVLILAVASLKFGFSHHSRYILPCVPCAFIWISGLARHVVSFWETASAFWRRGNALSPSSQRRWLSSATGFISICLLSWTTASSLAVYPHSISYFNEFAGGPKNGPSHLLNSNIDWGQDLLFLEKWIQDEGPSSKTPIHLAFYNYYNPFDLETKGIEPWPFRRDEVQNSSGEDRLKPGFQSVPDGLYAISVNLLYEFPWPVRNRDGRRYFIDNRPMAYLRTQEPVGWAGNSIRIFSAQQVRDAYAEPPQPPLWSGFDRDR